jgi:hypothetical protein
MFENTLSYSVSLHLSLTKLHILFALISDFARYIENLLFPIPPLISLTSLLFLDYLSVIPDSFLQYPKSLWIIQVNVTSILQSCFELFPIYCPFLIIIHPRYLLQISALLVLFYKTYCEFCRFFSILHIGPTYLCPTSF